MNQNTITLLEFDKIKELLLEHTVTTFGKEKVTKLQPTIDKQLVEGWLEETTEAVHLVSGSASAPLHSLVGLDKVMEKIQKEAVLSASEIELIYGFFVEGRKLKKYMNERSEIAPRVSAYALSITVPDELMAEIEACIVQGRVINKATPDLAKIRRKIVLVEEKIKDRLDNILKSSTVRKYLQDHLISVREGRYVIPVKAEYKNNVRGAVLDTSASGSTVFIEPEDIRKYCNELSVLKIQEEKEEYRILAALTSSIAMLQREISINIEVMAQYDFAFAKAKLSRSMEGYSVTLNERGYINIIGGRHPLLGPKAVPLNLSIGEAYRVLTITGPNTGGKTVVLKTVGLLTLMAQSGLHVPVCHGSQLAIFTDILVDIGDGQSIEQSLSTFSSHILRIKDILQRADGSTLVLLDELGAGTDPGEGMGLAVAILERLWDMGATLLVTTHYNEIKEFSRNKKGFKNGAMGFDLVSLKPLYELHIGEEGASNALLIALRLGLDKAVVERAHQVTYKEEKQYHIAEVADAGTNNSPSEAALPSVQDREQALKKLHQRDKVIDKLKRKEKNNMFDIGDSVMIKNLGKTGIVYELENSTGDVGVLYQGKKLKINKKRLSLHVAAKDLYPENYDMDIIFESKENRKKRHKMSKKHSPGLIIE